MESMQMDFDDAEPTTVITDSITASTRINGSKKEAVDEHTVQQGANVHDGDTLLLAVESLQLSLQT